VSTAFHGRKVLVYSEASGMAVSCDGPPTAFSGLSTRAARLVLAVTLVAVFGGAVWAPAPQAPANDGARSGRTEDQGDVALHQATLERTARGENYYDAVNVELRARRYPTRSIFNWRTPLPVWFMAHMPTPTWGRATLSAIGFAVVVLGFGLLAAESGRATAAWGAFLLLTGVLPCFVNGLAVMSELWAGALIALSVICYGWRWTAAGQATAVLALFFRELAAPYWVVCMGLAVRQRQWRDAGRLALGLVAYLAFYAWHAREVLARIQPGDAAHATSWIAFGGLPFVLTAVQMNGLLLLLPMGATVVYLVAAAIGFAGWRSPTAQRAGLTAAAYVAAFAVVGQSFNQYWGSIIAPLLCLGVAHGPLSLRDLWQRARA